MTTEEQETEEFDDDDPFGLNKPRPQTSRGRTTLGALAQENAVIRGKGESGELDEEGTDQ